jgi:protein-tyrosine phosphatase
VTPRDSFQVVFVCTGNRFRSPLAEAVFRRDVRGLPVEVSSAGTLDLGSVEVLGEAAQAARELGLDLSGHRSTPLAARRLEDADLVIGFERMHCAAAVVEAGAARSKTFTLPELVDLLEQAAVEEDGDGSPAEIARNRVRHAAGARPAEASRLPLSEVEDPLGLPYGRQRETAERVRELTSRVAKGLFR